MAAASTSSRARTPPRLSPSGTRDGSQTDPASPRDAHTTMTRAPASARRANVPPHASDSSSGCAKMPRMVRPASGSSPDRAVRSASGTGSLHETRIHGDVLLDHAGGAEPGHRPFVDAAPIEAEHARQVVDH